MSGTEPLLVPPSRCSLDPSDNNRQKRSLKKQSSDSQQTLEERPVTLQRNAQVFGGDVIAPIPLLLQLRAFFGKNFCQTFHRGRHKPVRLFDSTARFIHKVGLNRIPTAAQFFQFVVGK